jgi:cardiolipin synthase
LEKPRRHHRGKKLLIAAALLVFFICGGILWRRSLQSNQFRLEADVASSGEGLSSALEQTVGAPLRDGHKVEVLENGSVFDALVDEIGKARVTVHVEMYIWTKGRASDRVIAALKQRHQGVRCRILLDWIGSLFRGHEVDDGLRDAGCELAIFREHEAPTARNHRKNAVIDGKVGFIGGFGVDDRWLGEAQDEDHWRDTNVRVEGKAVADMQEAFTEDWEEATGEVLPGPIFPKETTAPESVGLKEPGKALAAFVRSTASPIVTRSERLSQLYVSAAHKRLWIANAYFVPGKAVLELLAKRAAAGVDVRLLVPGRQSDSKLSFLIQQREYGDLQKAGVRIWEYKPSMMHAKTMVVDSELSLIGSVNLDPLSLGKLEEGALVVQDEATAARLARDFEADCSHSVEQK